eukprot:3362649-Pleurochrysis_carterae.AAC.3
MGERRGVSAPLVRSVSAPIFQSAREKSTASLRFPRRRAELKEGNACEGVARAGAWHVPST